MFVWTFVKTQCDIIIRKKEFFIAFMVMMLFVSVNHLYHVFQYYGCEVSTLISFPEISLLGSNNMASYYFLKLYPFLLVIPAGFFLAQDKTSSMELLFVQRSGKMNYYISKYLAVFFMTFLCFTLPLFFEILLNIISFPTDSHGTLFGYGVYTAGYEQICHYPMFELYYRVPALYSAVMAVFFGFVTAVFAMLPSAMSCMFHRYTAYLLLPVYIFLYLSDVFEIWGISSITKSHIHFSMLLSWCDYVVGEAQFFRLFIVCVVFLLVSMLIYLYKARKDIL